MNHLLETIMLNDRFLHFAIYPKNGYLVDGVSFRTTPDRINGHKRPVVGDHVTKEDILHTWWCSLTLEETKRLYGDGVRWDMVKQSLDVILLG
jgi:hypothetical protein